MTIGSTVQDDRVPEAVYRVFDSGQTQDFGTTLCGRYRSRSWNGSDNLSPTDVSENAYTMNASDMRPTIVGLQTFYTSGSKAGLLYNTLYKEFGGITGPVSAVAPVFNSNDDLKLITKLSDKVAGSSLHLGNTIGEHGQLMRMLGDNAYRVARMLHYLRAGNFTKAADSIGIYGLSKQKASKRYARSMNEKSLSAQNARSISNGILELEFGWRPLVSDVTAAAEFFANKQHRPYSQKHRRTYAKSLTETRDMGFYTCNTTCIVMKTLRATFSAPLSYTSALRLNDPLSTLWEITPWSFVVDWALPISDYLQAVHFSREFNLDTCWRTTFTKKSVIIPGQRYNATYGIEIISGQPSWKSVSMTREAYSLSNLSSIPLPSVASWDKISSMKHMIDSVALLVQKAT